MLESGGNDPVALPQRLVRLDKPLRDHEQRQTLGAGAGADRASEHQVDDVLSPVVFAPGDEALHPLQVPQVTPDMNGAGGPGADVGAGVGLGEQHAPRPAPLHHQCGDPTLLRSSLVVEQPGEKRSRGIEDGGGVGAEQELLGGPEHGPGDPVAAKFLGEPEAVPSPITQCRQAGLHLVREDDLPVVEHQLVPVGHDEAGGPLVPGEALYLGKSGTHRHLVEFGERGRPSWSWIRWTSNRLNSISRRFDR